MPNFKPIRQAAGLLALALGAAGSAAAATVTSVHSFTCFPDGCQPIGGLVRGADGALYGTTQYGGAYGIDPKTRAGNGTIFRIAADGSYSELYSFTFLGRKGNGDGVWPTSALTAAPDGTLFGVTPRGGQQDGGAVFHFFPATGTLTLLHSFPISTDAAGGSSPQAPVALGNDGRLYGTTQYGGRKTPADGTVFGLNTDGSGFQVLASFGKQASLPASKLYMAPDGLMYGIAAYYRSYPGGALFHLAPDGSQYGITRQFDYSTEGGFYYVGPKSQVFQGPDGLVYGATSDGAGNEGSVYRMKLDGSGFQVLHSFATLGANGTNSGGARVKGTPVVGPDGLLYGTTSLGGANGNGTVWRMALDGSGFATLYDFPSDAGQAAEPTGGSPMGDVAFDAQGRLCGTTYQGGTKNVGAVFCLKP